MMRSASPSECYCTNARRSAGALTELYDAALKDSGLTASQFALLRNLERFGRANVSQWTQRVGLERSTMVRNAHLLERMGLIEQTEGRGKTFQLSARGTEAVLRAGRAWNGVQERLRAALGESDAAELIRLLRRIQELAPENI